MERMASELGPGAVRVVRHEHPHRAGRPQQDAVPLAEPPALGDVVSGQRLVGHRRQEGVAHPRCPSGCGPAHDEERPRTLHRGRGYRDRATEIGGRSAGECLGERLELLFEERPASFEGDAEHGELLRHVARNHGQLHPAVGQHVQDCDVLGRGDRVPQGEHQRRHHDPDRRGSGGDGGPEHEGRREVAVVHPMVFGEDDPGASPGLRPGGHGQGLRVEADPGRAEVRRPQVVVHQPILHAPSPF
jgi:hypothetical protein